MKKFIYLMCLIISSVCVQKCYAGDVGRGVRFECVTPCDVLLGAGLLVHETGKNMLGGIHTTARGIGEFITAPLRTNICLPPRRIFYYQPPLFHYTPGRFYEVKPLPEVVPSEPPVPQAPSTVYNVASLR